MIFLNPDPGTLNDILVVHNLGGFATLVFRKTAAARVIEVTLADDWEALGPDIVAAIKAWKGVADDPVLS